MTTRILRFFARRSRPTIIAAGYAMAAAIGVVDYHTGYEFAFHIFYLVPICLTTVYGGRTAGLFLSAFSSAVWIFSDIRAGHTYSHPLLALWASLALFGLYALVTLVLDAQIRVSRRLEEEKLNLERMNQELDGFAHVVSHDLRAPLRGILQFSELLRRQSGDRLDEEGREFLGEIRECAKNMNALIEDLFKAARIDRARAPQEDIPVDDLIGETLRLLKINIDLAGAQVLVQGPMPVVRGERAKLKEVFFNLVSNALKFSSKRTDGPPRLRIGYACRSSMHEFHVKDNGVGIAPEFRPHVFQIFKRYYGESEYEGTGSGLYIAKKIVERHGGQIWVNSKVGKGTTFYFTLPGCDCADPKAAARPELS